MSSWLYSEMSAGSAQMATMKDDDAHSSRSSGSVGTTKSKVAIVTISKVKNSNFSGKTLKYRLSTVWVRETTWA